MIHLIDPPGARRPTPLFQPGDLVQHKRYNYRGVIVEFDATCQADEFWYQSNKTQPDRNQPWYHVLVHLSSHATYVAQSNLDPDPSQEAIEHPMLLIFFDGFSAGRYGRNTTPWT